MNLYLEHFGFREAPFKITPTTEFFHHGGRRGEILTALQYAVESGEGIMLVTGEVGHGKTMLLRTLADKLPEKVEVVYIPNPSLSGREILFNICEELGLQADLDRPDTVRRLQDYLIAQNRKGRQVVVFIDEAQAMPDESLEEVRLLSNLETNRHKLLQMVLFGQPEILDKLARQNLRQLRERITVTLHLPPLRSEDVAEYVGTRLRAAGYEGPPLFETSALRRIAKVSQGVSRRINILADKALLACFARGGVRANDADVAVAVRDAKFGKVKYVTAAQTNRRRMFARAAAAAAALVLGAVVVRAAVVGYAPPPAPVVETAVVAAVETAESVNSESAAVENESVAAADDDGYDNNGYDGGNVAEKTAAILAEGEAAAEAIMQAEESEVELAALESESAADESLGGNGGGVEVLAGEEERLAALDEESEEAAARAVEEQQYEQIAEVAAVSGNAAASGGGNDEGNDAAAASAALSPTASPSAAAEQESATTSGAPAAFSQEQLEAALRKVLAENSGGGNGGINREQLAAMLRDAAEEQNPAAVTKKSGKKLGWRVQTDPANVAKEEATGDKWGWLPRGSYLRQRMLATRTWFDKSGGGGYTARLMTVSQERAVFLEQFLRHFASYYPIRNLMIYPMELSGREKFVVTFGVYGSLPEADLFLKNLPYDFTGGRPHSQSISVSMLESSPWW